MLKNTFHLCANINILRWVAKQIAYHTNAASVW
jgi:hypothetical protein